MSLTSDLAKTFGKTAAAYFHKETYSGNPFFPLKTLFQGPSDAFSTHITNKNEKKQKVKINAQACEDIINSGLSPIKDKGGHLFEIVTDNKKGTSNLIFTDTLTDPNKDCEDLSKKVAVSTTDLENYSIRINGQKTGQKSKEEAVEYIKTFSTDLYERQINRLEARIRGEGIGTLAKAAALAGLIICAMSEGDPDQKDASPAPASDSPKEHVITTPQAQTPVSDGYNVIAPE